MKKILIFLFFILLCYEVNGFAPWNSTFVESYDCYVEDIVEFTYNPKKITSPKVSKKYFKISLYENNDDGKYAIDLEDNEQLEFLWDSNFAYDRKGPWLFLASQYFKLRWINKHKYRFYYLWHSGGELDSIAGYNPTWLIEGICTNNK